MLPPDKEKSLQTKPLFSMQAVSLTHEVVLVIYHQGQKQIGLAHIDLRSMYHQARGLGRCNVY